jgi:hypothetical protein
MSTLIPTGLNPIREQQPLTNGEKYILQTIRNKKLLFLLGAYISLVGVLVRVCYNLWENMSQKLKLIWFINTPLVIISFFFLALTIFFLKYYLEAVHPFMKDLKRGMKDIIWFNPERYKTPFFEEFYLKTVFKKMPLVKINKEIYDAIHDKATACISISPSARFVFSIDIEGHLLQFNEKDFIIER